MAYIYLDDLKKILPGILDSWIDEDDESWEWIFQEIEQKCYVGKKKKDKKKWKTKTESMVNTHSVILSAHRNDINELTKRVDELSNKVGDLSGSNATMISRINGLSKDVEIAKTLADIAKRRTEVNYDQISKTKNDADVIQDVYNRMAGRGATREELDGFRDLIHKYDALEKKEEPIKLCSDCKYYSNKNGIYNCTHPNGTCGPDNKNWEAKENV